MDQFEKVIALALLAVLILPVLGSVRRLRSVLRNKPSDQEPPPAP